MLYMREQENIRIKWLKSRVTFGIIVAGRVREGKDAAIYPYTDLTAGTTVHFCQMIIRFLFFS